MKNKIQIFIKGHPRLGIPNIETSNVLEIPSYIPSEFINSEAFKCVLGMNTYGLCHFAKNELLPTYSIIDIFMFKEQKYKNIYKNYLKENSDNKIHFITSFEELETIISNFNFKEGDY